MKIVEKIKLHNFKRFIDAEIRFEPDVNLLIGDNESGKSSILTAIDLTFSGSRSKVETIGLENLFNRSVINSFLLSGKQYKDLPKIYVELFLNDQDNSFLEGKFNSEGRNCHGAILECLPNEELSEEIKSILNQKEDNFPFEYYTISFKTFAGQSYTGYRKFIKHILIDNSQINNEYATNHFIKSLYNQNVLPDEKSKHQNEYRKHKEGFKKVTLKDLNERVIDAYSFSIKTNNKSNLEVDLTIQEDEIDITQKGKGRQCFVKTDFALAGSEFDLDLVLLEEPENHLSHLNMRKLILRINQSNTKQLFIATHNDLICTRLGLKNAKLLNSSSQNIISLGQLSDNTAQFFQKAPDNKILEFVLSEKVILVEGNAEFILLEQLYINTYNELPVEKGIHFVPVGGTSFKRYAELSNLLKIKTAIIRDNDKDYKANCIDRYKKYVSNYVKVFADKDNNIYTFEVAIYEANTDLCEDLFSSTGRTLPIQEYMLKNKADVAFELLSGEDKIETPEYIKLAFEWIRS